MAVWLGGACLIGTRAAGGTTYGWDSGGGDNNWVTPANWNPDGVPGAGDDVYVNNGGMAGVVGGSMGRAAALFVGGDPYGPDGSGTVRVSGGTLDVAGTTLIWPGGEMQIGATGSVLRANRVDVEGGVLQYLEGELNTDITINTGTMSVQGLLFFDRQLTVAGGLVDVSTVGGSSTGLGIESGGALSITGGTLDGDWPLGIMGGTFLLSDGHVAAARLVEDGGTVSINGGTLNASDDVEVQSGTFTLSGGEVSATSLANLNGALTVSGSGELTISDRITLQTGGEIDLAGGAVHMREFLRQGGFNWTGGTLGFTQDLTLAGGQLFGPSVEVASDCRLEVAGTLTVGPDGTFALSGGEAHVTSFDHAVGTTSLTGGTLTVDSGTLTPPGGDYYRIEGAAGLTVVLAGGASADFSGGLLVGDTLQGTLVQAEAAVTTGNFRIGYQAGSDGTYEFQGGSLTTGTTLVGHRGSGTLRASGGPHYISHNLYIGNDASGQGTYHVSGGGSVNAYAIYVGNGGTGAFIQEGGSSRARGELQLARGGTGVGSLTLSGGDMTVVGAASIGEAGTGTASQTGGTMAVEGNAFVGRQAGSDGTWTISGGVATVGGGLYIGGSETANGGRGALEVGSGGRLSVGADITMWPDGTLNLHGGTLQVADATLADMGGNALQSGGGIVDVGEAAHTFTVEIPFNGTDLVKRGSGALRLTGLEHGLSGVLAVEAGTLLAEGSEFAGQTYFDATGARVRVDSGATFEVPSVTFQAHIGSVVGEGRLLVKEDSGAYVGEDDSTFEFAGELAGNGGVFKIGDGTWTVSGIGTADGYVQVKNGVLIAARDTAFGAAAVSAYGEGTLLIADGVSLPNVGIAEGGTLGGTGTVQGDLHVGSAATVAPGASTGVLTVDGDYTQDGYFDPFMGWSIGTLLLEMGGRVRGNEYDALVITGTASLDGTLEVSLIDGFEPEAGDQFDILDWGTLAPGSGFDTVNLPNLGNELAWATSNLYTTGTIGIVPEPGTLSLLALGGLALIRRKRTAGPQGVKNRQHAADGLSGSPTVLWSPVKPTPLLRTQYR